MLEDAARIQRLWTLELNTIFSKKPEEITEVDKSLYERLAYDWVVQFIDIYTSHHSLYTRNEMSRGRVSSSTWGYSTIYPARAGKVQRCCNEKLFQAI